MMRKAIVPSLLAGSALFIGTAAMAQEAQPGALSAQQEIEQLKAQVKALQDWKAQMEAGQAQGMAVAQGQANVVSLSEAPLKTNAPKAETPAPASAGPKGTVELYGSIQVDGIYDTNRVDPTWASAFRPSKIPTTEGTFGDDGQTYFSAKQSLFGISGSTEVAGKPLKAAFEFDLFGQGANAGETTFHLQKASVEWGPLLFGYDKTLFMDPDLFPNIIDYWGPSGMIYVKNAGVRYTPINSDAYYFGVSLELPGNDVDPGFIRILDPDLADTLTSSQKLPDLILAGRAGGDWGYVRLGGIVRRIGFETIDSLGGEPDGGEFGWGLNLTMAVKPMESTTIKLGAVMGQGIASYFNDGGTDLVPFLHDDFTLDTKAAKIFGFMAYIDQQWNDQFSTSIGYSRTQLDNTNFQSGDAFHTGDYASANLLYKPFDNLLIGGEALYGRREDKNGNSGEDVRGQISLRYSYSVKLLGGD